MEIKRIDNEVINEYPKMNEFNNKDLKKYLPKKWTKLGISSFVFGLLMKATKSNAININEITIDGGFPISEGGVVRVDPAYQLLDTGAGIFKWLSIILLIASIILTTIKKHKNKKEKTTKLTNKKIKVLYIITGISILISIILKIAYEIYLDLII